MMKIRRIASALLGALAGFCVSLLLLTVLLDGCGSSAPLMERMFLLHAPPADTGLQEEDYAPMAQLVTGYLSGSTTEFQATRTLADGTEVLLFHDYEQQHMADCRELFVLCRKVLLVCAALLVVCALGLGLLRGGHAAWMGAALGVGVLLTAALVLAVWGMVDFQGLFIRFHQLSFANSLWMLNPATDLLIRLMPVTFFIHYAAAIGGIWGAGMLLLLVLSLLLMKHTKHAKVEKP